jgi:LmbE family N-acetylglucosaminyl deacetylase
LKPERHSREVVEPASDLPSSEKVLTSDASSSEVGDGAARGLLSRRTFLGAAAIGAVGAGSAALAAYGLRNSPAAGAESPGSTLITVAHADDNLLFMSPDEYTLIRGGGAVQIVYLTTGASGRGTAYWHLREAAAQAGTASMVGLANRWRRRSVVVNGRALVLDTLVAQPRLTIIFMRLPDGNSNGSGYPETQHQSLMKLWKGEIPAITSADGARYTTDQLVASLAAIARRFRPDTIYTQNFLGHFGNGDHTDHVTTGYLTVRASHRYSAPNRNIFGYQGYPIHLLPPNVSGPLLHHKEEDFLAYSRYDPDGCSSLAECFAPGFLDATYGSWLKRQYVVAKIPAGSSIAQVVKTA